MKTAKSLVTVVTAGVALTAGLFTLAGCTASGVGSASSDMSTMGSPSSQASSDPAATTPANAAKSATITIKDFGYTVPSSVEPGAKITVKDADSTSHTVTSDDGNAFDAEVPGGGSVTFTAPTKPGSYPFHCTYHSNMHGVLVVKSTS